MNRRTFAKSFAVVLPALIGLSGCSSFSKQSVGPAKVDNLVGRIERVHVEAELAKETMRDALVRLHAIVSRDFGQDPVTAYTEFTTAIERSEEQSKKLTNALTPMRKEADAFFERWADNLQSFTNVAMRAQSQKRLDDTRARYRAVLASAEPAEVAYQEFNLSLRDHALFLGHDFNATSMTMIEGEVRALTERAATLDGLFDACLVEAREYIRTAALPMRVEMSSEEGDESADG